MFDVSLSELMVIGIVALVVIGPERLPRVARTVGHLLGRLQRYVNTVKADINREMHIEDIRRFEERMKSGVNAFETEVRKEVASVEADVGKDVRALETGVAETVAAVQDPSGAVSPAPTCAAPTVTTPTAGAEKH